jgi:hypothetical protein
MVDGARVTKHRVFYPIFTNARPRMNDKITIKGVEYVLYSLESANYGGMSKKDAVDALKAEGIKVSTNPRFCHTPYVGHYALLVEASREKDADKILFGM